MEEASNPLVGASSAFVRKSPSSAGDATCMGGCSNVGRPEVIDPFVEKMGGQMAAHT